MVAAVVTKAPLWMRILTMRVHSSFTTVFCTSARTRIEVTLTHHVASMLIVSIIWVLVMEIRVVVASVFHHAVVADLVTGTRFMLLLTLITVELGLVAGVALR